MACNWYVKTGGTITQLPGDLTPGPGLSAPARDSDVMRTVNSDQMWATGDGGITPSFLSLIAGTVAASTGVQTMIAARALHTAVKNADKLVREENGEYLAWTLEAGGNKVEDTGHLDKGGMQDVKAIGVNVFLAWTGTPFSYSTSPP